MLTSIALVVPVFALTARSSHGNQPATLGLQSRAGQAIKRVGEAIDSGVQDTIKSGGAPVQP